MRVAVERKLTSHAFWKAGVDCSVVFSEVVDDELTLFVFCNSCKLSTLDSEQVVQFGDKSFHCRDKLDKTLWNKNCAEVVAVFSTCGNDVSDVVYNIVESHIFCLDFFRNDTYVRLNLKCAFQCDVRCGATHQFDEVPIFFCRVAVTLDVADNLRVNFASCVKSERNLNDVVLQVAVDGFRASDNLYACTDLLVVFSKDSGICVGIITTDDYQCFDV